MAKRVEVGAVISEIIRRLNDYGRRIRLLEERMEKVENEINELERVNEENFSQLKISSERLFEKLKDIGAKINEIEEKISKLNEKTKEFVSKDELKTLESYVEMFHPLKSKFVTKDELNVLIQKLKKK